MNHKNILRLRRGVSLVEAFISTFIAIYIFTCIWIIYTSGWTWWAGTAPRVEAQNVARTALSIVIDGVLDPSDCGSDSMRNGPSYARRNGISWAVSEPDISVDHEITFRIESDANTRGFGLGDDGSGTERAKAVYYRDGSGNWNRVAATAGITDIVFTKSPPDPHNRILVSVTVTAQKTIRGIGGAPREIRVDYTDYVYLRNV